MLTVDPKHQYRGAGSMLVKWGVDIADQLGVEVISSSKLALKFEELISLIDSC